MELLKKWQTTINLVSDKTIGAIWTRHIIDSYQLFDKIKQDEAVVDIGSGAGFPGLVLAILGIKRMTLVESDARKVAFLREAARVTKTDVAVMHKRVETIDLEKYSLVIARGFAPLGALLDLLGVALKSSHKLLLLKGKKYQSELEAAEGNWLFDYDIYPSITEKDGVVLSVRNLRKRGAHG